MLKSIKTFPVVILMAIISLSVISSVDAAKMDPYAIQSSENECKLFLRTLAAAEYSYAELNEGKNFGTWNSLKHAGYIYPGRTRGNYIEDYSIMIFNVCLSSRMGGQSGYDSTFTIVAVPRDFSSELRYFSIKDDKVLRVWDGPLMTQKQFWKEQTNPNFWVPVHPISLERREKNIEFRRNLWEAQCMGGLRKIGSAQYAYAGRNKNWDYGSWASLKEGNYFPDGTTRANMIEHYSISLFDVMLSSRRSDGRTRHDSKFTIVATPISSRHQLRTFCISTSQKTRVWCGDDAKWDLFNMEKTPLDDKNYWQEETSVFNRIR